MNNKDEVSISAYDLFKLLDYIVALDEQKHYYESGKPKDHIWIIAKRIMKKTGYLLRDKDYDEKYDADEQYDTDNPDHERDIEEYDVQ